MTNKAPLITPTPIEELFKKASYMALHNEAKRQLYEVFDEGLFFAYDRGVFKATPELIQFTVLMMQEDAPLLMVDSKKTPILIENAEEFLSRAKETYHEALNRYYASYMELRKARKNEDFLK